MPDRTRVKDKSSLHKYRIEVPVLIDDMELSVYARSLYIHLKRVAGDDGSCWESARTLAKACGMSAGQVSKAKDELETRGLIIRGIKSVRGGIADDITIVDIWPECFKRYASESHQPQESDHHTIASQPKRSPHDHLDESDHHTITFRESDHLVNTLTSKRSPGDPKNHDSILEKESLPPPPTTNGGGGDFELTETERYLLAEEFSDSAAREFRLLDLDACKRDIRKAKAGGQRNGGIIRRWRRSPPIPTRPEHTNDHLHPPPSPLAGLPSHAEAKQKFRETAAQLGLRGATERETDD